MEKFAAEPIVKTNNVLGEGPLWIPGDRILCWTDILKSEIWRYSPEMDSVIRTPLPSFVACMGEIGDGRIITASGTGWLFYNNDLSIPHSYAPAPFDVASLRFNDGKVGPDGAFWSGSMDWDGRKPVGKLFRLIHGVKGEPAVEVKDGPFTIPNGMGWSPDGSLMYLTDTTEGTILRYDFDLSTGNISGRNVFVQDSELPGAPDGLTVDAQGNLWSARWGAGMVVAYDTDGNRIAEITVPAAQPSSCCFGGRDLNELYITSARFGLENPGEFDGALFRCRCGNAGLANYKYRIQ